jgi:hypothetical protein
VIRLAKNDHQRENHRKDTVILNAIDEHGDITVASFVLGAGVNLMTQTSSSALQEPDNPEAVQYMNRKLGEIASPPAAQPIEQPRAFPTEV